MNAFRAALAVLLTTSAATVATAQHADISPRVSGGRLIADAFDHAAAAPTPDVRVFGYDFQEDPLDPYFASDPGFSAVPGSNLPGGSQLLFRVPGASRFGLPANLSFWDGAGDVSFSPAPAGETLRLSLGAQSRTIGAATGDVEGFPVATAAADGSLHRHLNSFLQGSDGNADPSDGVVPADGIYLLPLTLLSSDPAIAASEPLFLVFNNGLSETVHDRALDYVESAIVPEPTSLAAGLAGAAAILVRRRRAVRQSRVAGAART